MGHAVGLGVTLTVLAFVMCLLGEIKVERMHRLIIGSVFSVLTAIYVIALGFTLGTRW